MHAEVQELLQEQVTTTIQPAQQIEPKQTAFLPLHRSQRRAKAKTARMKAMKERRHALKVSPDALLHFYRSRERLCPVCHLDFLGGKYRCQCKAQKPAKSKVVA